MINLDALAQVRENIGKARKKAGLESSPHVEIVAITKTFPPDAIISAYKAGILSIGENRVQEAVKKFHLLPEIPNLCRRFVGHLQSNKARIATTIFDSIDSVDTTKLGRKIARLGIEIKKQIPVLIQVNTSGDPIKYGFFPTETEEMLEVTEQHGLKVEGLMTIGKFTVDELDIRTAFSSLRKLKDSLNRQLAPEKKIKHLSMGMTADYVIAVEEGATMVRLGTVLYGKRRKLTS